MNEKFFKFLYSKSFISIVLSILSVLALPYVLQVENTLVITGSIISLICLWCFYTVIKNTLEQVDYKIIKYSQIMGIIFSAMLVFGKNCTMYADWKHIGFLKILIIIICFSFILTAAVATITNLFLKKNFFNCLDNTKLVNFFKNDEKLFLRLFLTLIICWIPVYIILFPGVFEYDVPTQLREVLSGQLTNWHPPLHTIYMYQSLLIGRNFFKSDDMGVVIYVIPQVIIMSLIFAYNCKLLAKFKLPILVQFFTLVFFALHPVVTLHVFGVTKDIIFSGLILLFALYCWEATDNPELFFNSKKKLLMVFLTVLFAMLFRTNGVIIFLILMPILLILSGKNWYKTIIVMLLPVVMYLSLITYGYPAMNIGKTPPEEPLSVPLHQIARVIKYRGDELSQEEKDVFFEIIKSDKIGLYEHKCMDYLKLDFAITPEQSWGVKSFNAKKYFENPAKYRDLWLELGKRYPDEYMKAFLSLNVPFWYPDYVYVRSNHSYNLFISMYNQPDAIPCFIVKQNDLLRRIYDLMFFNYIEGFEAQPLYRKTFLTAIPFSTGLPCWIILYSIFYILLLRKKKYIIPVTVPLIVLFTYLFAPTYLVRYNLPVIWSVPMLFAIMSQVTELRKTIFKSE